MNIYGWLAIAFWLVCWIGVFRGSVICAVIGALLAISFVIASMYRAFKNGIK